MMRNDVLSYFPNMALGARVLRMLYTQALYVYQRFTEIMKAHFHSLYLELFDDFVPLNHLTAAVKELNLDIK